MKRYLALYQQIVASNISKVLAYRMDAVHNIFSSLAWGIFSIVTSLLITEKVPTILGWDRGGMLMLTMVYMVIMGWFYLIFSRNFQQVSTIIHKGELDFFLLKPVDAQLLLTTQILHLPSIIRTLISLGLTIAVVHIYDIQVSPLSILGSVVLSIFSIMIIYAIHTFTTCILIFNSALYNLMEFTGVYTSNARMPLEMLYRFPAVTWIVLLPILFIINVPLKVLMIQATPFMAIAYIVFAVSLFAMSRFCWLWSLRSYTSASS